MSLLVLILCTSIHILKVVNVALKIRPWNCPYLRKIEQKDQATTRCWGGELLTYSELLLKGMEVKGVREVVARSEVRQEDLLVSGKVGIVKNIRDTSRVINKLSEEAPLEMYGVRLRQLK